MKDTEYLASYDNGIYTFYKNKKTLLGLKTIKVSPFEVFTYSKRSLKDGLYTISPTIRNCNILEYLTEKASFFQENNLSDFPDRTIWKMDILEENIKEFERDGIKLFNVCIVANFKVSSDKNLPIVDMNDFHFAYNSERVLSKDTLRMLFQNACNGSRMTLRDIEEYSKSIDDEPWIKCEKCNEVFTTLDDFYCHLLEEEHYDSILDEFPNDKEVVNVANILKNKLRKKGILII